MDKHRCCSDGATEADQSSADLVQLNNYNYNYSQYREMEIKAELSEAKGRQLGMLCSRRVQRGQRGSNGA